MTSRPATGTADEATANLLDGIPGTVFTTGDNVYPDGTAGQFNDCYAPSWGRHRGRTLPSPGNHDYHTVGASGYFGYFGTRAGGPGGYYAYDAGSWRVYSLNSETMGSAQVNWLTADLAANPRACVLAYWHHPVYSSGQHGNIPGVDALLAGAQCRGRRGRGGRTRPQLRAVCTPERVRRGVQHRHPPVRGRHRWSTALRPFGAIRANSEVRNATTHGVLKLVLGSGTYSWEFVPTAGSTFRDSGSGTCH